MKALLEVGRDPGDQMQVCATKDERLRLHVVSFGHEASIVLTETEERDLGLLLQSRHERLQERLRG